MDQFEHKTLTTKSLNLTYSYYLSPSFNDTVKKNPDLPVLQFCHGYPDDACELQSLMDDAKSDAESHGFAQ